MRILIRTFQSRLLQKREVRAIFILRVIFITKLFITIKKPSSYIAYIKGLAPSGIGRHGKCQNQKRENLSNIKFCQIQEINRVEDINSGM
ncbi:hypothetical protein RIR_jg21332.t1 [Rhizophagus irregularis DAOM 181602=DAOM 197198]|nr:hypothetical protein RIR_jg21332.t1 [Rhizophagus irregularis DAOM 181602=DAOM 197198]